MNKSKEKTIYLFILFSFLIIIFNYDNNCNYYHKYLSFFIIYKCVDNNYKYKGHILLNVFIII